jgi:redox-sensitive bicupin YhaK (pirin superfamily)
LVILIVPICQKKLWYNIYYPFALKKKFMNVNRKVKAVLPAPQHDMGGMIVRQPFPTNLIEQVDPFILLHHADNVIPDDRPVSQSGVGPHPHRGFSPVTFIFKGGVHHRDTRDNDSTIYAGGTQWMNAGMGVMHSERPADNIHELGSRLELIQLWVNTPASKKMEQPAYFPLKAEDTPSIKLEDGKSEIKVIAGSLDNVNGPVPTQSPVNAWTLFFQKGASYFFPVPAGHNAFIYLLDGKVRLEGYGMVEGLHAAVFENDGDGIAVEALEDTRALLMTGQPLNEKVVSHGPFVMNSEAQIMEAMRDYRMGKMGILIE